LGILIATVTGVDQVARQPGPTVAATRDGPRHARRRRARVQ